MGNPKRSSPNPIRERLEAAQALDLRRQHQISNQSASITRLLVLNQAGPDPEAATKEIVLLNAAMAEVQVGLQEFTAALKLMVDCYNEDPERLASAVERAAELLP